MTAIGVLLAILALVLTVIGGLATARRLPGNGIVGIRVPEVRTSRRIWEDAHHVAGIFWLVGGVALAFGALTAFRAEGWAWILPVATVIIAVAAVGAGANAGARTAAVLDVAEELKKNNEPAPPTPQVDLAALRRAANQADLNKDSGDGS